MGMQQVTKGKSAVKVCQQWSRKPLSTAETLLAERPAASSKSPGLSSIFALAAVQGCRSGA